MPHVVVMSVVVNTPAAVWLFVFVSVMNGCGCHVFFLFVSSCVDCFCCGRCSRGAEREVGAHVVFSCRYVEFLGGPQ